MDPSSNGASSRNLDRSDIIRLDSLNIVVEKKVPGKLNLNTSCENMIDAVNEFKTCHGHYLKDDIISLIIIFQLFSFQRF